MTGGGTLMKQRESIISRSRFLSFLAILLLIPGIAAAVPSLPSEQGSLQFHPSQFPIHVHSSTEDNNTTNQTDMSPPVLVISSPQDIHSTKTSTITVQGTASDDSGIRDVAVRLNTADPITAQGNTSWSVRLSLKEGRNTILVTATDHFGNQASSSISVVLESEKPGNTGIIVAVAMLALLVVFIGFAAFRSKPASTDNGEMQKENIEEPGEIAQIDDFDKKQRARKKQKKRSKDEEE
jgi:hypothetical protein